MTEHGMRKEDIDNGDSAKDVEVNVSYNEE